MKYFLIATALMFFSVRCHSQQNAKTVLSTLSGFVDQYNNPFENGQKDQLVIFYVAGLDDPMTLVFDKLKDRKIVSGKTVQMATNLEKMLGSMSSSSGLKHIQNACRSKYGNGYFSILLDTKGALGKQLKTTGLTVITINQKNNTINYTDYGTDRKKFLAVLYQTFK